MALGYYYAFEREANGWWLVRFPDIPEALTEGENKELAHKAAFDCLITALEGYMKAGKALPKNRVWVGQRIVLPSLIAAKLAVYEMMRAKHISKLKLAKQLGVSENAVRRLLDLRHRSHIGNVDEALAKMNAELTVELA